MILLKIVIFKCILRKNSKKIIFLIDNNEIELYYWFVTKLSYEIEFGGGGEKC